MAMVIVDDSSLQADCIPSQVALSEGRRPLGAVLRYSHEANVLSQ